ncbi:MAG: PQQ-like beta-propeller repeat protein [Planctomycetes bacterium]|nr:PQQ-like beta-propeller repeat protein [Planctomycetota bacterium]MCB9884384.1 PQQ-like beta-propeller repeat protein [Planctomycetota bacterium]
MPFAVAFTLREATGQQVQVRAPVAVVLPFQAGKAADDDHGAPVEMFENAHLDRYLRKAEEFFSREDYASAIQILQDVAEGRTKIEVGVGDAPEPAAGDPPGKPSVKDGQRDGPAVTGMAASIAQKERYAVFASDGRLFRPVRRLGQEMLAHMPANGIELYRTMYDGDAERMLDEALAEGSTHALQAVVDRYYVSLASGRALALLADRCMHEGRYRSAVQVLRDLLLTYPEQNRRKLGLDDTWLHFKIALCLAFSGEQEAAHDAAVQLAETRQEDSLRILGQLQAVKDLPTQESFQPRAVAQRRPVDQQKISWLGDRAEELVPLWQYRFADPDPYREPKSSRNNGGIPIDDVVKSMAMPFAGRYYPGTDVHFAELGVAGGVAELAPPRVVFLEHYRMRVADALTGVMVAESDGVAEPPAPRDGHPRVRIAACDYALLQAVEDDKSLYAVLGYGRKSTASSQVFRASDLVAYDRTNLQQRWTSADWLDGETGLRDVTFLAAPTVFGERLFLPSLRRDVYALECLDRNTGEPLWATPLHAGGTQFFKAPGVRVQVEGGTAYVVTNAGCLGAIDAFTGDLRWVRRYERDDPLRPSRIKSSKVDRGMQFSNGRNFAQVPLTGFYPSDLVIANGLVCVAPVDGDMLLCVDGASGQPVWMFDAASRYASEFGRLRVLIGTAADHLFACSDSHLVCLSMRGGLMRWARELPPGGDQKTTGRGRGAIVGDHVVVPGDRELLVFDFDGVAPMRRIPLPAFGAGRDPLEGSFQISSRGPWLAIGHAGGVELFSTAQALEQLSSGIDDPFARATCLVQASQPAAAEAVLRAAIQAKDTSEPQRAKARRRLLGSVRERALAAAAKDCAAGLAILDEVLPLLGPVAIAGAPASDRALRLDWHLARLDCCKASGDLRRFESEQQDLYDFMEGKR